MDIKSICASLREGADQLALQNANQKNKALKCVVDSIQKNRGAILAANAQDVADARAKGMSEALVERLALDDKKIDSIVSSMEIVIAQGDPVGEETAGWTVPNGMKIRQVRVPMGVVGIIYESRPNVTVDAFSLAYKSGNSILLRGSSSCLKSNLSIVNAIREGLRDAGTDGVEKSIYLCESTDHRDVNEILNAVGLVDVVLPRGSAKLINTVVENARVPVIQTGAGVCHLFVDESADLENAALIADNAKTQRPGACNAIETILVHRNVAACFLPKMAQKFAGRVQVRADKDCYEILMDAGVSGLDVVPAQDVDFGFEFLDMVCAVRTVENVDEAIQYINSHNTKHSECICTKSLDNAKKFQAKIDAACVYVNASTRFTDGGEFGFGAELGISTQKLHARGPMGIKALTTTKFLIDGDGQIR